MRITKFGHCCLLIEEKGLRILTDPGMYSDLQNSVTDIDVVLITHEHGDHFHTESVEAIMKNNPQAKIITTSSVGVLLEKMGLAYQCVEDGQEHTEGDVTFSGVGTEHAVIYKTMPIMANTGYFIGSRLFYPGDAFTVPSKPVEVLALPVAGPWMKMGEAVDYALAVNPTVCFPVHDAIMKSPESNATWVGNFLKAVNVNFVPLHAGETKEF